MLSLFFFLLFLYISPLLAPSLLLSLQVAPGIGPITDGDWSYWETVATVQLMSQKSEEKSQHLSITWFREFSDPGDIAKTGAVPAERRQRLVTFAPIFWSDHLRRHQAKCFPRGRLSLQVTHETIRIQFGDLDVGGKWYDFMSAKDRAHHPHSTPKTLPLYFCMMVQGEAGGLHNLKVSNLCKVSAKPSKGANSIRNLAASGVSAANDCSSEESSAASTTIAAAAAQVAERLDGIKVGTDN